MEMAVGALADPEAGKGGGVVASAVARAYNGGLKYRCAWEWETPWESHSHGNPMGMGIAIQLMMGMGMGMEIKPVGMGIA